MKNIIKSTLLLLCSVGLLAACEDDNDSNPVLTSATSFVLNTPSTAANNTIDLGTSSTINLTCSQPNYGFPASTTYTVDIASKADMSDALTLATTYTSTLLDLDANEVASALTDLLVQQGRTEAEFPLTVPMYVRAHAVVSSKTGTDVESTGITSNVVTFNSVRLPFSLPPVSVPTNLYITGNFNGWSWETSLQMVGVYGAKDNKSTKDVFWHMVYIDDSGIKFNTAKAWDGGEVGFAKLNSVGGDLASEIKDNGGNIASSNPGWYLMIVTATVSGRNILYDVQFNKPEVWLMGTVTPAAGWAELEEGTKFTVPSTANGDFVSPAFANNTSGDGGIRVYVKIPEYDWWKSEFMVFDKKIVYRGTGGDQERINGTKGQQVYLNFTNETGDIK